MSLWTSDAIAAATGGAASAPFNVDGVAFDSREVGPGDLFIALKGEATDGHRFVEQAFAQGAAGAIVSVGCDGPHIEVADTMNALNALAQSGRARSKGRIIGVTGSVGKTSAKEALAAALDRAMPGAVHRSVKSYNNHTGVPLSLARMPTDARFGVFEMGMNHAGELSALTRLVRPHVAVVTAIAPAHIQFFADESAIADAKGEIFQGLEPGGTAIIPHDSPHRDRLASAARPYADHIVTFGLEAGADVRAVEALRLADGRMFVMAVIGDSELSFTMAQPGMHWVSNGLAVLAAVQAVGGDLMLAGLALAEIPELPGRGERVEIAVEDGSLVVIDESYNANPTSMRAALAVLGVELGRRVAVLGEMRELGEGSAGYHGELATAVEEAGVHLAILVGEAMAPLAARLEGQMEVRHVADATAAGSVLGSMMRAGDIVLVKGSNGVGLSRVVAMLRSDKMLGSDREAI